MPVHSELVFGSKTETVSPDRIAFSAAVARDTVCVENSVANEESVLRMKLARCDVKPLHNSQKTRKSPAMGCE